MIEPLQNALPVRLLIAQGQDTLFVRLSPDVLATLVAAASSQLDDADVDTNASSSSFSRREWRWTPPTAGDSVSFLPLEMLVGERTIYASYNGGRIILAEESSSMGKWIYIVKRSFIHLLVILRRQGPMIDSESFVTTTEVTMWKFLILLPSF
jgi:hypothetical protein